MAPTLATIPPEILDSILSIGLSQGTLNLWLSGDRALQRHLAQSVTSVHLHNSLKFSMDRLPLFLLKLRKLRRLTVDRELRALFEVKNAATFVRKLPPTLTELRLLFRNSAAAVAEDADVHTPWLFADEEELASDVSELSIVEESEAKPQRSGQWRLADAFPNLSVLAVDDHTVGFDLSTLPPLLTDLTITVPPPGHDWVHFHKSLPRQLLRLELLRGSPESVVSPLHWRFLPPSLHTFISKASAFNDSYSLEEGLDMVRQLPRSLTHLETDYPIIRSSEQLAALPPGLTYIDEIFEGSFPADEMAKAMPLLKRLDLNAITPDLTTPAYIRSLPANLTELDICANLEGIASKDWPKTLTKLVFAYDTQNLQVDALPLSLTHLQIRKPLAMKPADMSRISQSLTDLSCYIPDMAETELALFPPRLTSLYIICNKGYITMERSMIEFEYTEFMKEDFTVPPEFLSETDNVARMPFDPHTPYLRQFLAGERYTKCFPFEALPPTLTAFLSSAIVPFSKIKDLPRRLRRLHIGTFFRDAAYDSQDAETMAAMRDIMHDGLKEGVLERFDSSQLQRATPSALLPRTLTDLSTDLSVGHLPGDWLHMPPNMIEICLHALEHERLDTASLHEISKQALKDLWLDVESLSDEDCKVLPKTLTHANLRSADLSHLTDRGALYTPPNADILVAKLQAPKFRQAEDKRTHLLNSHLHNEDDSTFRKLYKAHENVEFCLKLLGADPIEGQANES